MICVTLGTPASGMQYRPSGHCASCGSPAVHLSPAGLCSDCAYPISSISYDFRSWGSRVSSAARRGGVL